MSYKYNKLLIWILTNLPFIISTTFSIFIFLNLFLACLPIAQETIIYTKEISDQVNTIPSVQETIIDTKDVSDQVNTIPSDQETIIDTKEVLDHFNFMLKCNATVRSEHLVTWDLYKETYCNVVGSEGYKAYVNLMINGQKMICVNELSLYYDKEMATCLCDQAVDNFYKENSLHLKAYDYADTIDKFIKDKQASGMQDIQGLIKAIEAYLLPQVVNTMVHPEVPFDIVKGLSEVDICVREIQLQGLNVSDYIDNSINTYKNFLKNIHTQNLLLELSKEPHFKNLLVKKPIPTSIPDFNPQVIEAWYPFNNVDPTKCGMCHEELREIKLHYLRQYYHYDPIKHTWSNDFTYKGIPSEEVFFEELNKKGISLDRENYRLELPQALTPKKSYIDVNGTFYDIDVECLHLDATIERWKEQNVPVDSYIAQAVSPHITMLKVVPK